MDGEGGGGCPPFGLGVKGAGSKSCDSGEPVPPTTGGNDVYLLRVGQWSCCSQVLLVGRGEGGGCHSKAQRRQSRIILPKQHRSHGECCSPLLNARFRSGVDTDSELGFNELALPLVPVSLPDPLLLLFSHANTTPTPTPTLQGLRHADRTGPYGAPPPPPLCDISSCQIVTGSPF